MLELVLSPPKILDHITQLFLFCFESGLLSTFSFYFSARGDGTKVLNFMK